MATPEDDWQDDIDKRHAASRPPKPQGRGGERPAGRQQGARREKPEAERSEPRNLVYGARAVMEALETDRQIDKILIKKGLESDLRNDIYDIARARRVPIQVVPVETLDRLARNANHQGVVAYTAEISYADLEQVVAGLQANGVEPVVLMIDQVSDVRNFGGIARTAECLGVHAIVVPEQGSARINADAMKISSGALHHIPVCRVNHLQDSVHLLQGMGLRIVACVEKASTTVWEADLKGPVCFVFGSEEKGITPRIIRSAEAQVGIPMLGKVSSLNVGVSVGIVLAEAQRQRRG
jgi:23S rRNA (guanosine2251-2'-O)-methyltransferase